eukprot:CAMPEP_0196809116 /NCGR_PEP_ID=MMETSP1362-20130617/9087_1 /TAXON_ID=163516 /ORGANISM="Leptocylindrus danicus, Strain CCMP1856" /LENGTH=229 /DNA_ID=CAMNT_0042183697 /DNA_START=54 /DNA_END=743 /DNA_ORIENTATION=-
MASEEERQKILAEYYASAGKDDDEDEEDEAEFSEEESDEDAGGYDDSDSDAGDTVVTLTGNCTLSKEGDDGKSYKYVYKGTWDDGKYKFKYKSKLCTNKSGATDDELLKMPTPVGDNSKTDDNNKSTLLFDGFFYTAPDSDGGTSSKIKERDVEISFFAHGRVEGRGANDFGAFYLEGQYDGKDHSLTLEKGYGNPKKRRKSDGDGGDAKKAKSGGDGDDDDDEEEFEF